MRCEYVKSSGIKSIGYDPAEKVLEVEFLTGHVYQYFKVPKKIYLAFISADSKGRYFDYSIRDYYAFKKIK